MTKGAKINYDDKLRDDKLFAAAFRFRYRGGF
jgi:hypothetical protein